MNEHLVGGEETQGASGADLPHVKKWTRTKHASVFRLSNDVIQINFSDHLKLVLNTGKGFATLIDKECVSSNFYLADVAKTKTEDAMFNEFISRLQDCKGVIEPPSGKFVVLGRRWECSKFQSESTDLPSSAA